MVVANVRRADTELARFRPDTIVVSLDDPEAAGWRFMFDHGINGEAAVIAITAQGDASQELTVLRLGARDYIRLPVSPEVLFARIAFRTGHPDKEHEAGMEKMIEITGKRGLLSIDRSRFQTFWLGAELALTKMEFKLLITLAHHDGLVKSREQLIETVYDHAQQVEVADRSIDSHIKRLRNKFRKVDPIFDGIETIYGIGYKLNTDRTCRAKQTSLAFQHNRSSGPSSYKGLPRLVPVPQCNNAQRQNVTTQNVLRVF